MLNFVAMNTKRPIESEDDLFLRELMLRLPVEKAPEGFTAGIMQQVYSGVEPVADDKAYRRQMLWAYASLGAALIMMLFMLFAQWPFLRIGFINEQGILQKLLHASISFFSGFNQMIAFIKGSSTTILIFMSLTLLLVLERVFRSRAMHDRSLMF